MIRPIWLARGLLWDMVRKGLPINPAMTPKTAALAGRILPATERNHELSSL
jgi:hypothetical protein